MMPAKFPKDPDSEEALNWVIKNWRICSLGRSESKPVIAIYSFGAVVARINVRDVVKKRQPLTGAKKAFRTIVQGKRKKK